MGIGKVAQLEDYSEMMLVVSLALVEAGKTVFWWDSSWAALKDVQKVAVMAALMGILLGFGSVGQ